MKLLNLIEQNPELLWCNDTPWGTDKHNTHDYVMGFYDQEFEKYQDKEIDILEIGIEYGASLALWSKYFTKANIVGLDIDDQVIEKYSKLDRVRIAICDAYLPEVANQLGEYDIIIDDGPHTLDTMLKCIELYLPKVKTAGVLVIEDVQDTAWFASLTEATPEEYKNNIECFDLRIKHDRYDDLMFVVRK